MKISIIHASYGRPTLQAQTAYNWLEKLSGTIPVEYILSIDNSDKAEYPHYINPKQPYVTGKVVRNDTNTAVQAINKAAQESTGDIIIVISDDFDCPKDWDLAIMKAVGCCYDWILKTQDGTQPWIITLPIMDRVYYERYGYVYPKGYEHMFVDTHLTHQAEIDGRKITSQLLFKHNHYSVGGITKDATSLKADATWNRGEQTYLAQCRKWREQGLDIYTLPAEAKGHRAWLKSKGL